MARIIEYYDDERNIGNGIIITLKKGFSFEPNYHESVRGFDTVKEVKEATKRSNIFPCSCNFCKS